MNWFRRKKRKDRFRIPGTSRISGSPGRRISFSYVIPVLLALFAATLWLVPQVALASTNYTATQTSDYGASGASSTGSGEGVIRD